MKLDRTYLLKEIAAILECPFFGNENLSILGINEIHRVVEGDVAFVDHPKYYDKALQSKASVVLIDKKVDINDQKGIIVCDDPFSSFNFLLNYFRPFEFPGSNISSNSIDPSSKIHSSVSIGNNVAIGKNCLIFPNVSILNDVIIGDNVIIHSGVTIGGHGFYYKNRSESFERLNSCGSVVIEDNVEIGANTTIDKGVTDITRIGKGTKIDNLVQIGHDTIIGEKCLIAAQAGIAGCVTIGKKVTIWGQVGIASGITIGDGATFYAQSGVGKNMEGDKVYFGSPVGERQDKFKELALLKRLPDLFANSNKSQ